MKKTTLILLVALLALGFAACDPGHSETLYIVNRTGEALTFEMESRLELRGNLFPWDDASWTVDTLFSDGDTLLRSSHPLQPGDTVTFRSGGIGDPCLDYPLRNFELYTSHIGLRERTLLKDLLDPLNWKVSEHRYRNGGGNGFYTFDINPEDVE